MRLFSPFSLSQGRKPRSPCWCSSRLPLSHHGQGPSRGGGAESGAVAAALSSAKGPGDGRRRSPSAAGAGPPISPGATTPPASPPRHCRHRKDLLTEVDEEEKYSEAFLRL
ncbi:unnamed protein product [Urochloa humidicola]